MIGDLNNLTVFLTVDLTMRTKNDRFSLIDFLFFSSISSVSFSLDSSSSSSLPDFSLDFFFNSKV